MSNDPNEEFDRMVRTHMWVLGITVLVLICTFVSAFMAGR